MYNATARYEELAVRFHAETGRLAPSKVDKPTPEHLAAWWAWWRVNHRVGEPDTHYPGHVASARPPEPPPIAAIPPLAGLFW